MTLYGSWGRYPATRQTAWRPRFQDELLDLFAGGSREGEPPVRTLAYGNGRSYGDSCLSCEDVAIDMRGMDRVLSFDPATGHLRCESGMLLDALIQLALPHGWFPPVTPGTRFITLGGAIANDVHGKNHHRVGSFGDHVLSFDLLTSDGRIRHCSRTENADWFGSTLGGLGLTGIVTVVELKLKRVAGPWMQTESIRFGSLGEFFELSLASKDAWEYTVAWTDCLASGKQLGRGHFLRANHGDGATTGQSPSMHRLQVPVVPPLSLVGPWTLRPFNSLYYNRQQVKNLSATRHYIPYFYPLDAIKHWNRLYGPKGFQQFQCVFPPHEAEEGCTTLLKMISHSGEGSFLAVLKQFGESTPPGWLSFSRPGTTLALDFAQRGARTNELLSSLSRVVEDLGGAIYPAKDAQMSARHFQSSYPKWEQLEARRDPRLCSRFWRRVALQHS